MFISDLLRNKLQTANTIVVNPTYDNTDVSIFYLTNSGRFRKERRNEKHINNRLANWNFKPEARSR